MERHTPYARGPYGPSTQTDGRFWTRAVRVRGLHDRSGSLAPAPRPIAALDDEPPQTRARHLMNGMRLKEEFMRPGLGPILLSLAMIACHSKTKATADLLASLDIELSRTETEAHKCLRELDERSEVLSRKLSFLHDTHQRAMHRNYANVVPL